MIGSIILLISSLITGCETWELSYCASIVKETVVSLALSTVADAGIAPETLQERISIMIRDGAGLSPCLL